MTDAADQSRGQAAIEAELAAERQVFSGPARWMIIACTLAAIVLAINQLFNLRIANYALLEGMYLYVLSGLFFSLTFLTFRAYGPPSSRRTLVRLGSCVARRCRRGIFRGDRG